MSTPIKIYIGLSGLVLALIVALVFALHAMAAKDTAIANQQHLMSQNAAAYTAQLHQKDSTAQNLALQVENLNAQYSKDRQNWNIEKQQLHAQLDSFQLANNADSTHITKDSITVTFSGQSGIFHFTGFTTAYLTGRPSIFGVNGWYSPFNLYQTLYYDTKTNLYQILTTSDQSSLKFSTFTSIASSVYNNLMPKVKEVTQSANIFPSFGLLLKANLGLGLSNVTPVNGKFNTVSLDVSAMAYYKYFNVTYYPFSQYVSAGVFYNFDAGKALNKLF